MSPLVFPICSQSNLILKKFLTRYCCFFQIDPFYKSLISFFPGKEQAKSWSVYCIGLLQLKIIKNIAPGDSHAPQRYHQHLNAQRFLLLPATVGTQTSYLAFMGHVWQKATNTFPMAISCHAAAATRQPRNVITETQDPAPNRSSDCTWHRRSCRPRARPPFLGANTEKIFF